MSWKQIWGTPPPLGGLFLGFKKQNEKCLELPVMARTLIGKVPHRHKWNFLVRHFRLRLSLRVGNTSYTFRWMTILLQFPREAQLTYRALDHCSCPAKDLQPAPIIT